MANYHVYSKGANAKPRDQDVQQQTSDRPSSHQGKEQAIRSNDRGTGNRTLMIIKYFRALYA